MDLDTLLTGAEAARYAEVSRQLIRRWRQLGHLHPIGTPPRYRLRDVLQAEATTRRSVHSRRTG